MRQVLRLSARETAGVVSDVLAPLVARGVIVRRPPVENLADRLQGDKRAVARLQRVRDAHGSAPVLLGLPGRDIVVVLSHDDVRTVLDRSPEPFALANREKVASLRHFQPDGVLISPNALRPDRRRFNEEVLQTGARSHAFADRFAAVVAAELRDAGPSLDWDAYAQAWWRIVRRVTFGDAARDDGAVTDEVARLRSDANWAFMKPRRDRLRRSFFARLEAYVDRAEPTSLAALVASVPRGPDTAPAGQIPQWLFAFDAAGQAAFRALALLLTHAAGRDDDAFLRASVLESVRLWPTTPAILRDATRPTELGGTEVPAGAGVVVFAPFFHRDDARLDFADRFAPELWFDGSAEDWPLVPFSAGPGECPGRNLVLLLTSLVVRALLERSPRLTGGRALSPDEPLPATLSPFRLRFAL